MLDLKFKNYFMPMPSNIYYWWNFGSLLFICLLIQIGTGLFLSMFYENNMYDTFSSVNNIDRNINMGWLLRSLHANGASLFFIMVYMHIGRGLYFKSFYLPLVWLSGGIILLLLFMIAFIGYVLPWGQMSFWGATVITNLLSSIPYAGKMMTLWLWGNFSVSKATLSRFFSLHFILPFVLIGMIMLHIIFLHSKGSSNPLGFSSNIDKIPFQPYFISKDILGAFVVMMFFMTLVIIFPLFFMDPDNFQMANPMITPPHIQPEWYFLFAYAILRSIPNKLGGVVALLSSILILFILPFIIKNNFKKHNLSDKLLFKSLFFLWVINFFYLSLMGAMPIEEPFESISKVSSILYFMFYFVYF